MGVPEGGVRLEVVVSVRRRTRFKAGAPLPQDVARSTHRLLQRAGLKADDLELFLEAVKRDVASPELGRHWRGWCR